MSLAPSRCEDCARKFVDAAALFQHRRFRHPKPVRAEPLSVAVEELRDVMRGIDLGEQP